MRESYLYCVADSGERVSLGKIGVDGSEVYTVPYSGLCAVVHDCQPHPFQPSNEEMVRAWVMAHQKVVETAWERWGTVLPTGFGTIVRVDAQEGMRRWLEEECESLRQKIAKVQGKAEYGVQVFWDPQAIAEEVAATSPEIRELEEEIRSKPRGAAYMYRQRLERLLKERMEARADLRFREWCGRIREHVDDVRIERVKRATPPAQMLMNLSCLVDGGRYAELRRELEEIDATDGLSVRLTGPWPPYSFVGGA